MDLCCVNRTICEAKSRDASQLSPAALSIDPLQSPSISNPATHRNSLDRGNVADKLKVHGINVRKPPRNRIAIVRPAAQPRAPLAIGSTRSVAPAPRLAPFASRGEGFIAVLAGSVFELVFC